MVYLWLGLLRLPMPVVPGKRACVPSSDQNFHNCKALGSCITAPDAPDGRSCVPFTNRLWDGLLQLIGVTWSVTAGIRSRPLRSRA